MHTSPNSSEGQATPDKHNRITEARMLCPQPARRVNVDREMPFIASCTISYCLDKTQINPRQVLPVHTSKTGERIQAEALGQCNCRAVKMFLRSQSVGSIAAMVYELLGIIGPLARLRVSSARQLWLSTREVPSESQSTHTTYRISLHYIPGFNQDSLSLSANSH